MSLHLRLAQILFLPRPTFFNKLPASPLLAISLVRGGAIQSQSSFLAVNLRHLIRFQKPMDLLVQNIDLQKRQAPKLRLL
jgi:hypothetical protein